jgi:hypothetical protein
MNGNVHITQRWGRTYFIHPDPQVTVVSVPRPIPELMQHLRDLRAQRDAGQTSVKRVVEG